MFSTAQCKSIGLILDLSIRQMNGRRIVDVVKKQISQWIRQTLEDSEDYFYLYHPEITVPTISRGESLACVNNFNTEGWLFDLVTAVAQTFCVVHDQDADAHKAFLLISDRMQNSNSLRTLKAMQAKYQTDCRFLLCGIGKQYNKSVLNEYASVPNVVVKHLVGPEDLASGLSEFWSKLLEAHGEA